MEKIFIIGKGFLGEHLCRFFTEKYSKENVLYFTDDLEFKIINKENYTVCELNTLFEYKSIDNLINSLEDLGFIQELTKKFNINQYHQVMYKKNKVTKELIKACPFKTTFSYITTLYGAGQPNTEMIPIWINRIIKNKPIELKRNCTRGWIYVTDFCRAVDFILQYGVNNEAYCISSDCHVTDFEVVTEIIRILNKSKNLIILSEEDILDKTQECTKIKELGWEPIKSISRGLELTIKWQILDTFGERIKNILIKAAK